MSEVSKARKHPPRKLVKGDQVFMLQVIFDLDRTPHLKGREFLASLPKGVRAAVVRGLLLEMSEMSEEERCEKVGRLVMQSRARAKIVSPATGAEVGGVQGPASGGGPPEKTSGAPVVKEDSRPVVAPAVAPSKPSLVSAALAGGAGWGGSK